MTATVQKRPVVYLETTFVSRLTGWLSRVENSARKEQLATRALWRRMEGRVEAVISEITWTEIGEGDPECAKQRKLAVAGLPMWMESRESRALMKVLLECKAVNAAKPNDAGHIAVAAVGGADVLLSWNFQDIANDEMMPKIRALVERAGFRCPRIVAPDKLPEDWP